MSASVIPAAVLPSLPLVLLTQQRDATTKAVHQVIAKMLGVSEASARSYKRRYRATVNRELDARNTLLHAIIHELDMGPIAYVAPTSAENGDNRRLLRESRQVMAASGNDCRAQRLGQSAGAAVAEGQRLSTMEQAWEQVVEAADDLRLAA